MIQRQLPAWARRDHPAVRYILGPVNAAISASMRVNRVLSYTIILLLMGLVGVLLGTDFLRTDLLEQPTSRALMSVIFWPVFAAQIIVRLAALSMTIGVVGEEVRRQTWDSLRTTASGAGLAIRARWGAVIFYRLRGLMVVLWGARLLLIAALLYDLTAFSGEYLDNLTAGITPGLPVMVAVLLLALTMTASMLLPITGAGFDAALGLFVSTLLRQRVYILLVQIAISALYVGGIVFLLLVAPPFRDPRALDFTGLGLWLLLLGFAAVGDWGLSLLWLGYYAEQIWADVPYGIFIGLGLMAVIFVQTLLIDGLLALTVRRAEASE